jgi:hypothetical protein
MMLAIGWVTVGILFIAAGLVIYETAMLMKSAQDASSVVDAWLEEVEANNEKADALLR